jgi:hypothetical protein
MEKWQWFSVNSNDINFFDFYRRIIRCYCNITGEIKVIWKNDNIKYKFVFDKMDEDIFGIEVYKFILDK